jgi:hypothetical protein
MGYGQTWQISEHSSGRKHQVYRTAEQIIMDKPLTNAIIDDCNPSPQVWERQACFIAPQYLVQLSSKRPSP